MKSWRLQLFVTAIGAFSAGCSTHEPQGEHWAQARFDHNLNSGYIWIELGHERNAAVYEDAFGTVCGENPHCRANYWTDRALIPMEPANPTLEQSRGRVPVVVYRGADGKLLVQWFCSSPRYFQPCPAGARTGEPVGALPPNDSSKPTPLRGAA